ncbi:hypothetical protein Hypma_005072 [Hypsizygus marmoreus]|uniref:Uncharacterized protein n=1 Tax=Hypsizygus marmoreus TaxID=39966 RepID=A0A369K5E1_HYPMA|nr:hypothetical protein Hypma_005072 [Hypsizygus marmoreus]
MFVPFVSSPSKKRSKQLYRRKGGGGRGGGGGSSGGGKGGSSGSGGGRAPISTGGSTKPATSYSNGGGKAAPIPAGQLFAGRTAGGGTRDQVYGNKQYGSGYPGVAGRGVAGRGFPFVFWPLAWGGLAGAGAGVYLHNSEYGRPNNSSRPGGPMVTAAFISSSQNTTFRVLADNATVTELITDIKSNCSSSLNSSSSSSPSTYEDSLSALPQPEQAIQYYRASSVALTLDGYNNTGALGPEGTPDTPIPTNIDQNLLDCLNQTIGEAVPLIDGVARWSAPNLGIFGLFWVLCYDP